MSGSGLDYADTAEHGPSGVLDLLGTAPADLIDQDRPASTAEVAAERRDRIRAGIASYHQMRQDIADAFAQQDWRALGHPSWHAYVTLEFGDQLAALRRDDRRAAVADLRQTGMSTRQIAGVTGQSKSAVDRQLSQSGTVAPEKITGSDGKARPATKPAPSKVDNPEPRREVIDEQTAAKLEQDAKLDAELHAAGDGTSVRFRANWGTAARRAAEMWTFDVDRLAEVYAADFDEEVEPFLRQMERFIDGIREAHRKQTSGLRVINGGAA